MSVERGTIHALLGGNGSGKSTLIKILAGVVSADAGTISLDGLEIAATEQTPASAAEHGLHFVHQQDSTFQDMTVAENLGFGRGFETGWGGRIRWRQVREHSRRVLDRFAINTSPDTRMRELGPALHMMIAIARALQDQDTAHSGVLVLDEPTASLPPQEVEALLSSLQRYAENGQTILYVTHRLEEVARVADRATVLRDGRLLTTLDRPALQPSTLANLIAGRALNSTVGHTTRRIAGSSEEVLSVGSVAGGAGLALCKGEIVGLAGLLGSGRTSLLRALGGAGRHPLENVSYCGREVTLTDIRAARSLGIVYVPEDRTHDAAFAELSISHNLSITTLDTHRRYRLLISSKSEGAASRGAIDQFHVVVPSENAPLSALSGGNQQKIMLARWMQLRPRLLLLDEPTQGVDVGARADIHGFIRQAVDDGAAALVVSSDFEELALLCDRVVFLREGQPAGEVAGAALSVSAIDAGVYAGGHDVHP